MKFTTCGMCGEEFINTPCSIYKLEFAGKVEHFCCYTCYKRAQETKEKHNKAKYQRLRAECRKINEVRT